MKKLLGIDIGGTKCAVILGNYGSEATGDVTIIDRVAFPTEVDKGLEHTLGRMIESIDAILKANNWKA